MANASVLQQRKTKQDTYITESGDILRGDEATPHLIQKDAEEILKESGMRGMLEKINTKKTAAKEKSKATGSDDLIGTGIKDEKGSTLVNNESPDTNKTSNDCSDTQCQVKERTFFKKGEVSGTKVNTKKVDFQKVKMKKIEGSTSATGADVSIATAKIVGIHGQATVSCSVDVEATGLKLKAAHADITGVKGMAKTVASASATGANISVATTDIKGVQGQANVSLDAEATGLNIKAVHADVTGTKGMAKLEASASATGGDISVGKADITGIQGQASATINAEAHGFNVKTADADISGVKATAKTGASASATGADITVAKADITGIKAIAQAEAKASATGFKGNFATADVTGVMTKVEKQVKAEIVGAEKEVGNASITGIKKGYTATAKAKAEGASLTAGNVDITGVDATVSTTATATVAVGEANLGNVRVGGYQGSGAVASAELKAGIDAGNINIGTHNTAHVGVSTKVGIGNVDLSIGPPSLVLSPELGLSLGRYGRGGGKKSKTKGFRGNGPTGEGNTENHEGSVDEYVCPISQAEIIPNSHIRGYPGHLSGSSTGNYTGSVEHFCHITGSSETYVGGNSGLHTGHNGCDKGSHIGHSMGSHIKGGKEVEAGISGEEGLRYCHSAMNKPTLKDTATGYCPTTHRQLDTKQSGHTSSYHQQLEQKLHEKIGQLPEMKGTEMPSKSVSAPLSREESKQQLKDQLRTVRKSLAKQYREELGDRSDSKDKSSQNRKSDDDNNINDDIEEPPIKKPFGDQKNIHTVDMIVPKSTKKTRKLRGTNVVGFED